MAAPASLSILTSTFAEGAVRNRALGIFGGVAGSAACIGLIVSGVLTGGPGWRWIFLINVPIGIALVLLVLTCIPKGEAVRFRGGSIDVLGAVTVTAGLVAIVYAINRSVDYGWVSTQTLVSLAAGAGMLVLFVIVEKTATSPLIPLSMFRLRTLTTANVVAVLVMGSFLGTAFQTTLFLQQVAGYSPLRTGLAGVVTAVTSVVVSSTIAAPVVSRLGAGWTLVVGQGIAAAGLLYLSRTPIAADYWTDLVPAFFASGVGIGLSGVAMQVVAFTGVKENVSGLAGGMISTAQEFGAAVGLAIIATAAAAHSANADLLRVALADGFRRGTMVGAGFSIAAALIAVALLQRPAEPSAASPAMDESTPEPDLRAAGCHRRTLVGTN
jgi:hypothetical protein